MPLEKAPVGSPGFSRNVETEVKAGKPVPQAVAIAYKMSGERQDASPIYEENGEFFFPKPGSMERYGPYASKAEATSAAAKAGVVSDAERDLMGESTGDDEAILGRKDAGGKYLVTKQFIGGNLNGITIKDPSPVSFEVGKTYGGGGYTGPKFKVVACSRMDSVKADADPYVVMRFQNNPSARGFVVSVNEFVKKDELGRLHFRKIDGGEAGTKKAAEAIYDKLKAKYASRIKAASADRADATPTIREENGQWVITIDEGTNTSIFRLDVREYPTKAEALEYALSNPQYTNRKDSLPPLDRALAAADSLYAKALKTAHKDAATNKTYVVKYVNSADKTGMIEIKAGSRDEAQRKAKSELGNECKRIFYVSEIASRSDAERDLPGAGTNEGGYGDADALLSLHAACAVMKGDGFGENSWNDILQSMKDAGKIRRDGYVLQSDLNKFMRKHGK